MTNPILTRRPLRWLTAPILVVAALSAACGGGGDGDAVALGPDANFSSTSDLTSPPTDWEGTLLGLLETDVSIFNSETGTCVVLVGTMTPTAGPSSGVVNPMSMRSLYLELDGEWMVGDDNACDTTAMEAAGYGWIFTMQEPVGTTYPFFKEFFLAGVEDAEVTRVGYGNSVDRDDFVVFKPTFLTEVPAP